MSVESPEPSPPVRGTPPLRREALLPSERSRGLGTVAVVCTMAGVASGLALATTLMAMQVADSMSVRSCPYRVVNVPDIQSVDLQTDHGYLGIAPVFDNHAIEIVKVQPSSPAEAVGLEVGDRVISMDGMPLRSEHDFRTRIYNSRPGTQLSLVVDHRGSERVVHPTLTAWQVVTYDH